MANSTADAGSAWIRIRELGRGGQGVTYLAYRGDGAKLEDLKRHVKTVSAPTVYSADSTEHLDGWRHFSEQLNSLTRVGALKVIHEVSEASKTDKARARMAREIAAMTSLVHPHFIRLLDHDRNSHWYVTEYHPGGTLTSIRDNFTGRPLMAFRALRGIVDALSELHKSGTVHRDIKPDNIFIADDKRLILGDCGLIYFSDAQASRVSETLENVGSRDWMPGWAFSMRVEEVKPTFDVFGLGKVLYSMVSTQKHLPLWYHQKKEFNVKELFPGDPAMEWVDHILRKSVVEHEAQCAYENAREMLAELDRAIAFLSTVQSPRKDGLPSHCVGCGLGEYGTPSLSSVGSRFQCQVSACNRCGHVYVSRGPDLPSGTPTGERAPRASNALAENNSNSGDLVMQLLVLDWTNSHPKDGLEFIAKIVVDNPTVNPDTIHQATVMLDGDETELRIEGEARLAHFDRKELVLRGFPKHTFKSYKALITIKANSGRRITIQWEIAPGSRSGSW